MICVIIYLDIKNLLKNKQVSKNINYLIIIIFIEFFLACIIVGLEYIHSQKIIHRDIKPENLVLDENGYVRITDFGIAKSFSNNNAKETSGTPGYMAPEVMKGQNHTYAVDFFALGIMGYEFMLGRRPYNGRSRREIKEQMLSKLAQISLSEIPNGWSEEAADFFNKLLQRKPDFRLGSKGIWELKQHKWLKYFPWDKLINKELESPFIPDKKDNFDKKYCEANDSINIETKVRYEKYRNDIEYESVFINFTYYKIITENTEEQSDKNILENSLIENNNDHEDKQDENKENEIELIDLNDLKDSSEEIFTNKSNKFIYNNLKNDNIEIRNQNINNSKKKYIHENIKNIAIKKNPSKNTISFSMKFDDNYKNENYNINKEKIKSVKKEEIKKQTCLLKNDNILDDFSDSSLNRFKNKNNQNKFIRSKTPIYMEKRKLLLEENSKNYIEMNKNQNKTNRNSQINKEKLKTKRLLMSQSKSDYKENIRNLLSKNTNKKMNICSPGYYSKHSLQINCNSNKFNNLTIKRNSISDYNKTPTGSMSSIIKSPKVTTSTSSSLQGYKKRFRSITPFNNNKKFLIQNNSVNNIHKNLINQRSNSRINLSNIYNQNYSYVKRIKEMNSFNYNNKMMNNISNIKNKNNKKKNEIISSYSISSSNILKQIRKTNYNKNKINVVNRNNPLYYYNNVNHNQRIKQNNKISLELELNADSQTFSRFKNSNNIRNENKSKKRKTNSNITIKNNILNRNHSTINISSMKMAMNGNININVVIKGNNNTTNLINKIELKKRGVENDLKNKTLNKKLQRSHSAGFFNLKL